MEPVSNTNVAALLSCQHSEGTTVLVRLTVVVELHGTLLTSPSVCLTLQEVALQSICDSLQDITGSQTERSQYSSWLK